MGDYHGMEDFKLHLIESITDNFADDRIVGSGGYGDVYKVWIMHALCIVSTLQGRPSC